MRHSIYILLLVFCMTSSTWSQELLLEGSSIEGSTEPRFELHEKMHVTRRCSLHVLLNTDGQTLWFVELVKRKHKKEQDIGIHKIIKRQKKLSQKRGVAVSIADLVADFKSFRYMTKPEEKPKDHFVLHYLNTKDEEVSTNLSLAPIYKLYTEESTTFVFDDKNRSCVEER